METETWAVVHHIHRTIPHQHIARLFITNVPSNLNAHDLKRVLSRAGRKFGEFGTPWANHYLAPRTRWEDQVEGAWNCGEGERIAYDDLPPLDTDHRITMRLQNDLHARLRRVAHVRGVSAHTVLIEAISGYIALQEQLLGLPAATGEHAS